MGLFSSGIEPKNNFNPGVFCNMSSDKYKEFKFIFSIILNVCYQMDSFEPVTP